MNRAIRLLWCLTFSILAFSLLACATAAAQQASDKRPNKPVYESDVFSLSPSSYDDVIAAATIVARIRVTRSEPKIIIGPNSSPVGWLVVTGDVLDIIKGRAPDSTIVFEQRASHIETDTIIVTSEGQQPLEIGHEYMVFLAPQKVNPSRLLLAWGREGVFEIDHRTVKPFGISRVARERNGMSEARFMRELRDRVSRAEVQK